MTEPLPESPLPADLRPITHLVGTVATFHRGAPTGGSVTFRTDGYVVAGNPAVLIAGATETVPIDPATGRFEVDWVPGNDPDGAPSTVTATFALDNGVEIPERTIVVPITLPEYPPLLDENGQPVVDASGNVLPDTSQAPVYPDVNFFAQAPVPELPIGETTAPVVLEDTTLFTRRASEGAPNGVATLDENARIPVYQIIDPLSFPDGSAVAYDRPTGRFTGIRVDARWRGAITQAPTDEGTRGDYFTNLDLYDGGPILWGCIRSGGPVEDGSPDEAQWLPFGGGGGGGGGGVVSVGAAEPLQSSGGANPLISILPATTLRPGSMSAAHFVKLTNIAEGATAYNDEQAQDAAARMLLAGAHSGVAVSYDDAANAFTIRVTAEAGLITSFGADLPLRVGGTGSSPQLTIDSATDTTGGALTAAQAQKLAGVAAGATKNATDQQLRDRSTHTGQMPPSAIDGLEDYVRSLNARVRTVTADTTLTAADEVVRVNSAGPVTVTYPSNSAQSIGVGNTKVIRQVGAGVVTVVGAGVTLNGLTKTAGQNTSISVMKVGANEADVEGGVA